MGIWKKTEWRYDQKQLNCDWCYLFLKERYGLECIPGECTWENIKPKLRKLYLRLHPDKGGDAEQFIRVRECIATLIEDSWCDFLSDPDMRPITCSPEFYENYRPGYKVKGTCIPYRAENKQDIENPECEEPGHYYRKGYEVKPKCNLVEPFEKMIGEKKERTKEFDDIAVKLNLIYQATKPSEYGSTSARHYYPDHFWEIPANYVIKKYKGKLPFTKKEIAWLTSLLGAGGDLDRLERFHKKNGYYLMYAPPSGTGGRKAGRERAECEGGDENRSPSTGRCMKPCDKEKVRNPVTNRCKKR